MTAPYSYKRQDGHFGGGRLYAQSDHLSKKSRKRSEHEKWSIAKQTGIYFVIISLTMLPIAYFTHWMERSVTGFLLYLGIFLAIFVFMWVAQYCIWRKKIRRINQRMQAGD